MASAEQQNAELEGQGLVWRMLFGYIDSAILQFVVHLRIADIMHSHGRPITATDLASHLPSHTNVSCLERVMRFLAGKGIFTAHPPSHSGETLYGLAPPAEWLRHGRDTTLAPFVQLLTKPALVDPWRCITQSVTDGGVAFENFHGVPFWDYTVHTPDFNRLFNEGMACTAALMTRAVLSGYADGFKSIGSLVDVGGGSGMAAAEIAKAHPHLKAINFDRPKVIAVAPEIPGVTHVAGDMFQEIPSADAIFMKWVMHDWGDEDCVKILKNCRKSIPQKRGKVIIVDAVLRPDVGVKYEAGVYHDLILLSHFTGGKERTEAEWQRLLASAGFPRYTIKEIPALLSIVEGYPEA